MILLVTQQRDIYNTSNSGNVEKGDLDVILLIVCCLWGCVVSLWHLISLFSNNEYLTEGNSSTFTAMRNVLTCRMEKFPVIPLLVYKSTHGLSVWWAESCPCCSQPMVAAGRYHLQSVAAAHQSEGPRPLSDSVGARALSSPDVPGWCPQSSTAELTTTSTSPGSPSPPPRQWRSCRVTLESGAGRRSPAGWRASAPGTTCHCPARTGSWWTARPSVWWLRPCSATESLWGARHCTETSRSDSRRPSITSKISTEYQYLLVPLVSLYLFNKLV